MEKTAEQMYLAAWALLSQAATSLGSLFSFSVQFCKKQIINGRKNSPVGPPYPRFAMQEYVLIMSASRFMQNYFTKLINFCLFVPRCYSQPKRILTNFPNLQILGRDRYFTKFFNTKAEAAWNRGRGRGNRSYPY